MSKTIHKTASQKNPKVESYFRREQKWLEESQKLRAILLGFPLTEDLKWGKPCYACEGNNVVLIQGFKEYCALLFFKGALLKDAEGILVKPGKNTQASRQIRFTTAREIVRMKASLKAYIHEAIGVEQAGLKVQARRGAASTAFRKSFKASSPPNRPCRRHLLP